MSKEAKILTTIAIIIVAVGSLLFLKGNPQPIEPGQAVDSQSLLRETSHMTGDSKAKVTLVEFGDFQCPACAAAHPIVKKVLADYQSNPQFNFVFRQFPLISIHPNAMPSAQASEAAGKQGKFWEMYDRLYETQNDWSTSATAKDLFTNYASSLGLDAGAFRSDLDKQTFREVVQADIDDGTKLGVQGTPTFYLNGQKLNSIPSYEEFKQLIDAELAK